MTDERRTMNTGGQKQIAVGHQRDSGDLKISDISLFIVNRGYR